jgi:copper resistance protein D
VVMDMDDPSLTTWLAIVRAIHFASCLLIASVWIFDRLVVKGSVPAWRRMAMAILLIATPLALVSGAAWFVLVTANVSDLSFTGAMHSPNVLKLVLLQTRFGRAWQIHLVFWSTGVVVAGIWMMLGRGRWIGLVSGIGLVGGVAWAGHGSTGPAPAWHLTIDVLHLLAAAVWPAGLVPLGLILPGMIRSDQTDHGMEVSNIVRRFSACSLIAVGLLTLTGAFNSWCLLGSFHALFTSSYGRVLLVKLVFFAGMVGLGAMNLLVLKPWLGEGAITTRRLWRNVIIEIVLGAGVVAAVGLLGLQEPSRTVEMQWLCPPANESV